MKALKTGMKLLIAVLLSAGLVGCLYKADCWVEGENIYHAEGYDKNVCAEKRGTGWWKIPWKDKPVKSECECWMR